MAELVYVLCAATSFGCALMLFRGYRRTLLPLLFWSCACFACLTATNVLLFVDLVVYKDSLNLALFRHSISLLGLAMLLYGMIWEST